MVVGPALGHAEGRALTLQLALGLWGRVPSVVDMLVQLLSCPQFSCTYGWERFLTERCAHYLHYTVSLLPIPANQKKRQWEILTASASWSLPDTHTEIIKVVQLLCVPCAGLCRGWGGNKVNIT